MAAALISMAPLRTRDRNIFLVIDFQSQFEGLGRLFLAAISSNWNANYEILAPKGGLASRFFYHPPMTYNNRRELITL
ncbi:uncharacterized protein UV8b_07066 [Ustilaginoidea virens]|uniref:Uncharacterized protein n=1 Tax=Ustilaginoidea virens TaxID=1159556 RepID=A0A8E5HWC3_USTVR|nr:uncharacterized protein UV8b_07066 [Ustilaginoidea virens]QUC22825.1 hypothetical protein UV8b_07066 [Ustilaginoidea virens]